MSIGSQPPIDLFKDIGAEQDPVGSSEPNLYPKLQALVSRAWKVLGEPGSATAADITDYLAALSVAGGGSVLFPPSTAPWVLDDEILMASNTTILLSPGVTITRPDPFTLTCTTVSGSPNVTVVGGDTSRIKTTYYKAHYVVGTGVPVAARISSIWLSSFTRRSFDPPPAVPPSRSRRRGGGAGVHLRQGRRGADQFIGDL